MSLPVHGADVAGSVHRDRCAEPLQHAWPRAPDGRDQLVEIAAARQILDQVERDRLLVIPADDLNDAAAKIVKAVKEAA